MITFRQWAVDGKFKYPIDFTDPALAASVACVGLHGTPFGNELYQQFSLKALDIAADAPDCTWTFEFKDPENGDFLRLNFVVKDFTGPITFEFNSDVLDLDFSVG
jgi:hypothetical protein